jgi:TM2 domain-containing membrane protein YozV
MSDQPQSTPGGKPEGADKKLVAGLLAILLGSLAVHKFYLGYTKEAVIHLVVSLITCGAAGSIIGLIEGIMYLTKSDEEFVATYIKGRKPWF